MMRTTSLPGGRPWSGACAEVRWTTNGACASCEAVGCEAVACGAVACEAVGCDGSPPCSCQCSQYKRSSSGTTGPTICRSVSCQTSGVRVAGCGSSGFEGPGPL